MRPLLVRTLAFFALVAIPTVIFDLVYWSAPLPWSLLFPCEVALRLTVVAFVTAAIERRWPRAWMPLAVFLAAAIVYALGYFEGEYLNGMLHGRTPESGMKALVEHVRDIQKRPRYHVLLSTIVAIPFTASSIARLRRATLPVAMALSGIGTLFVTVSLIEPFRVSIGRPTAAFIVLRSIFCGLLLPAVAVVSDRYERRPSRRGDHGGPVGAAPHE